MIFVKANSCQLIGWQWKKGYGKKERERGRKKEEGKKELKQKRKEKHTQNIVNGGIIRLKENL